MITPLHNQFPDTAITASPATDLATAYEIANSRADLAPFYADPDFAMEAAGAQKEIENWWPIMNAIADAPRTVAEIVVQCARNHVTKGKLTRLYYKWDKSGRHYSSLINRAKYPDPRDKNIPAAFVQFLCTRYDAHQRLLVGRRAIDISMAQFAAWERDPHNADLRIPGYDEPPTRNAFTGVPRGWTKANLGRLVAKEQNAFTRALRKQGPKSASIYLPKVHTTRAEMYYAEAIYFDDDVLDTYSNLTGINSKATRAQAFTSAEALCGKVWERAYKPELERRDVRGVVVGSRVLNQDDFFWFVIWNLMTHGYSTRGTGLVFEWGTANVDKRDKEKYEDHFDNLIRKLTNNLVYVIRSGKFRDPSFKGMLFEGQSSGNFRFKAPLESWFNLFRNYASMLAGATGRNPASAPEENYGLMKYNERSLKLLDKLPRERFLQLRRPVWEWEDLRWASQIITEIINRRDDHELEGWDKLGFRKQKYRLNLESENWMSEDAYLSLPEAERAVYDKIVCQDGYFRSTRMSPHDADAMFANGLRKLPSFLVPQLAPPRMWKPVVVQKCLEIVINARNEEEYADSEDLIYIAKVRTAHGHEVNLERGKRYFRLLNIFNPDVLWIAEADGAQRGRFIGTASRVQVGGKFDEARALEQLANVNHVRSVETAELRARTVATAVSQRLEMRDHNAAVNGGQAVTAEEIARENDLKEIARELSPSEIAAAIGGQERDEECDPHGMESEFSAAEICELFKPTESPES